MKLYKFYSKTCTPCKVLSGFLSKMELPPDVELAEIDVQDPEGKDLVEAYGIISVPTLMFPNGKRLVGLQDTAKIKQWIHSDIRWQ